MEENNKDTQVVEEEVKENTSVKTYTEQIALMQELKKQIANGKKMPSIKNFLTGKKQIKMIVKKWLNYKQVMKV